jgi:chromosome segregation ATPase
MQLHSSGTCDPLITISERDYLDLIAKCNALEAWMKGCYPVKNSAHDHSSLSTAQIEYVDLSLAYTQITALVQNLTKFQSERDSAKSQAEADRAKWTLAQTELAKVQSQLLEVDSERTSLEQQLHHTNLDREALESRLAQMQELQDHFDVANAELVDLRTASTTVVNEHDHLRHLLNATKSKLASGSSHTDSSITIFDHDSMTAKVARLKHRLQVSEAELVAVKDELRTYQSTTSALSLDRAVAVSSNSPVDTTDGFSALHHALDKIKSLAAEFGSSEL